MYTLIQQYGEEGHFGDLPVPSLVEDEYNIRLLITGPIVPIPAWDGASESGAQGVVRVLGAEPAFISVDDFIRHRTSNPFAPAYEVDEDFWFPVAPGPFFTMDSQAKARPVLDNPFVHLHTHTEFSSFDGLSNVDELVKAALADGQSALAVTDHGNVAAHPALHKATLDTGIKPIYGMEAYFHPDRFARSGDQYDYNHLVLWALDDQGLQDLWALSTEGYRDGLYGAPRIDWDSLTRLGGHLAASTACLGGPVLAPYLKGNEELAVANLARLGDIFGERLYIEMHANHLDDQLRGNDWLVGIAKKYKVPMIAVVDSHYATASEKDFHKAWIAMQTSKDVEEKTELFGDEPYHLMTAEEVRQQLAYLGPKVVKEAMANTAKLAGLANAEIKPEGGMPIFTRPSRDYPTTEARKERDIERMMDIVVGNWPERITTRCTDEAPYFKLAEYELPMLYEKGFAGYFLITADFVTWAKNRGILVGPGRGSGAASLGAFTMRITEIDPVEGDLSIDRFMTQGRKSLPDFDIDIPSSRIDELIVYVQQRWGADHVARVGSHMRIKNKSAFKDVQRSIASRLPADSFALTSQISKIIDEAESSTAGLGLSWDDLFAQVGDLLEPYREKMPELFLLAEHFRGRLKTYGKHAAGIIIDTDNPLVDTLPMRDGGEGKPMVTQFDMEALEWLHKVKYDLLSLRNLDTIQDTVDLIRAHTGDEISPYGWTDEYRDPEVFEGLSNGWTLGVFQIETNLGTRTTKQIQPVSRYELTDIITIGRPGPMRSGLDKLYMRRRSGEEPVSYPDERLSAILGKTWGVMLYQEDIMAVCRTLGGYTPDEADDVRRILGKKKVEQAKVEGRRFIERAVENGTDKKVAEDIWAQMEEFAKYSFNRAHAYSYATLSMWTAWLKTHYPREFLTAAMATIKQERIPQFVSEARRLGYQVLPPDINISGRGFTADGLVIRYGLEAISGIGGPTADGVIVGQPYTSYEDFIERRGKAAHMGVVKKLAKVGAFDSLVENRRGLEHRIEADHSGESVTCQDKDLSFVNEHGLPCHFDWSSEPIKIGRSGKPLATQPTIPKKCTKACRHYTPKPPVDYSNVAMYTESEIRDIEFAMLGVYLSSSPFDRIPEEILSQLMTADELTTAEFGVYPMVVLVSSVRRDPQGRDFGFGTFTTPAGEFSAILFSKQWEAYKPILTKGRMALCEVIKQEQDRFRIHTMEGL